MSSTAATTQRRSKMEETSRHGALQLHSEVEKSGLPKSDDLGGKRHSESQVNPQQRRLQSTRIWRHSRGNSFHLRRNYWGLRYIRVGRVWGASTRFSELELRLQGGAFPRNFRLI